jgi:hypothetical protein
MTVISLIDVVFVDILYNFVEGWICSTEITSRRDLFQQCGIFLHFILQLHVRHLRLQQLK